MTDLWVEKYRPNRIDDCILPESVKSQAKSMVAGGSMPHMLFCGDPGTGKTTLAKVLCNELGCDYMVFNGSDGSLNIDALRNDVADFAQTVNLDGSTKPKVIIIDEADGLSKAIQDALRNPMEKLSKGCRFILTCNYPDKIIPPLRSRTSRIDFKFTDHELNILVRAFANRMVHILDQEKIPYDFLGIAKVCKEYFPDNRRIINEVQRYVNKSNKLDEGITLDISSSIKILFACIENKDFSGVKDWLANNVTGSLFNTLYKEMDEYIPNERIPLFIDALAYAQQFHGTVPNQELNLLSAINTYMNS